MILERGVVGVTEDGVVFTERLVSEGKARKVALKAVGKFTRAVAVGKIVALFVNDPLYPMGCSPNYGVDGRYETCYHCLMRGDICRLKDQVDMSDGGKAGVVGYAVFNACKSMICWVFARFMNRYGFILDRCIEEWDNAWLNRGNEGRFADLVLFAGSEDSRLALFVRGMLGVAEGKKLPNPPFKVKVQSVDYWGGLRPQVVNWETVVNGTGLFLVHFGRYVLPFRAYYSFPASVPVKPGFSGSNAYIE